MIAMLHWYVIARSVYVDEKERIFLSTYPFLFSLLQLITQCKYDYSLNRHIELVKYFFFFVSSYNVYNVLIAYTKGQIAQS